VSVCAVCAAYFLGAWLFLSLPSFPRCLACAHILINFMPLKCAPLIINAQFIFAFMLLCVSSLLLCHRPPIAVVYL